MTMLRRLSLRLALPAVLAAAVFPLTAEAQPQESQQPSVAEAARRAREQKKKSEKPVPVITEDTLKPAATEASSAAPQTPTEPEAAPSQPAPSDANAPAPAESSSAAGSGQAAPNQPSSGESDGLKQQVAEAQKEIDLLQRELALLQDSYYSNPDYVHDTAGKAKLTALQQQISDKQQELDRLKTRLAASQELQGRPQSAPPAPAEKPAAPPQP
jgi:uncharacterized coiled-coil protein SlyX